MSWLSKFPWVSSLLLLLTYAVFGWLYGSWTSLLVEEEKELGFVIEESLATVAIEVLGAFLVLIVAIIFTAPIALMTLSLGKWIQSEVRAFMGVLVGAIFVVLLICWLEYVVHLIVLAAAATLSRLDLQIAGYSRFKSFTIIGCFCLLGFLSGVFFYTYIHPIGIENS